LSSLYVPWIFDDLAFRVGNPLLLDWLMGSLAILVLLEATRRSSAGRCRSSPSVC
jgi:TRAP-type uncharacterized transport system fused permease subunit